MKSIKVTVTEWIIFSFLLCQPLFSQSLTEKLEKHFALQNKKEPLNGVIIVQKEGKTIYEKAFGYASVELNVNNTLQTKFPIASITKPFISVSILLLEQQNLLNINDKISRYLPQIPESWKEITIKNLLTQTSGISDYQAQPNYDTLKHLETNNNALCTEIIQLPLNFKPGESYEYTNSNYVLLTCILEKVSELPVDSFVRKNICKPLGLRNTFFPNDKIPVKNLSEGYIWEDKLYKDDHINFSNLSGAGGLISTAGDLSIFLYSFLQGKLLEKSTTEKMITPFKENYGYGWMVRNYGDKQLLGHSGGIPGYYSQMWYEPKEKFSVIYLSNVYNGAFSIITNTIDILSNNTNFQVENTYQELPPIVPYKLSASSQAEYIGSYKMGNEMLRITNDSSKLYIKADSENAKAEMIPYNSTKFWIGGPGNIAVVFIKDKVSKKISRAEIRINGNTMIATRE